MPKKWTKSDDSGSHVLSMISRWCTTLPENTSELPKIRGRPALTQVFLTQPEDIFLLKIFLTPKRLIQRDPTWAAKILPRWNIFDPNPIIYTQKNFEKKFKTLPLVLEGKAGHKNITQKISTLKFTRAEYNQLLFEVWKESL